MKNGQDRKAPLVFFILESLYTAFVYLIVSALFFRIKWNLSLKITIYLMSTDHSSENQTSQANVLLFLLLTVKGRMVHISHVDAMGAAAWMPCWVH